QRRLALTTEFTASPPTGTSDSANSADHPLASVIVITKNSASGLKTVRLASSRSGQTEES
ncbi:hypothetical protein J6590_028644, partial [Homalodisca vitripennis]